MLDNTTLKLFGKFPREVGNPARSVVHNLEEFEQFILQNNGINDCFTSTYPLSGEINKVSFDSDEPNALKETKQLYKYLKENDFRVVLLVSGKKGYHIHIQLRSQKYDNAKVLLLNAHLKILEDAFGVNKKGELICSSFDSHVFGDIRRIFRIPNTLRPPENKNYCTYLPPNEFLNMTEVDIAQHMKATHTYDYSYGKCLPTLNDFPKTNVRSKQFSGVILEEKLQYGEGNQILKNVLRPCLYRHIISQNPKHMIRVAVTVDLLKFFSLSEIIQMYSKLHWKDFNWKTTEYQIKSCEGLQPYSCKTLIKKGVPQECCIQ